MTLETIRVSMSAGSLAIIIGVTFVVGLIVGLAMAWSSRPR